VFLVGGFAASPYLFTQVKAALARSGVGVVSPDDQTAKAVADGALSYYVDNYVCSRVAKISYYTKIHVKYEASKAEHKCRQHLRFTDKDGEDRINGGIQIILEKGASVSTETEFRRSFYQVHGLREQTPLEVQLNAYRGASDPPTWEDEVQDKRLLTSLCTITGNVPAIVHRSNFLVYRKYEFDVVILLGGPELKAQVAWKENGNEVRGPATVVYDVEDEEEEEAHFEDYISPIMQSVRLSGP